ncbi:hypothetical protein BCR36DRAFT_583119 [Piromyces finnis]|uniref:Uncharacterized protein n=1 Tax=Piromyces finnis TaxID=1754191 RepID=A0A1Y1VAF6_9FUNG|nr:hypothetical protein BCR36DRAFT_583119 [Piromyces finnis]|eukprot:ORX51050.1 hypothetical protein BCR36DRAFT_583119 [Piromyces finnis]
MAPSGHPKKNLILVGEGFSYLVKPWDESQTGIIPTFLNDNTSVPLNNLDRLAKEGSSGTLMIEKWNFEGSSENDLLQLLGYANIEKEKMSETLMQRYGNIKINVISNVDTVVSTLNEAKAVNQASLLNIDYNSKEDIIQLTKEYLENASVLFIHLKLDSSMVKNGFICFDNIISEYIDNDDIGCVVALSYADRYNNAIKKYYENPQLHCDSYQLNNFVLPQQSGCHKAGLCVEVEDVPISVCYRHNGSIRCDKRQKFSEEDCKNGGNNSILTYHFLAELAFKLGFTSKFGA